MRSNELKINGVSYPEDLTAAFLQDRRAFAFIADVQPFADCTFHTSHLTPHVAL